MTRSRSGEYIRCDAPDCNSYIRCRGGLKTIDTGWYFHHSNGWSFCPHHIPYFAKKMMANRKRKAEGKLVEPIVLKGQ